MAEKQEPKKPYSGFADIVNEFAEADRLTPRRKSQPTTMTSMLNTAITDYPRETATATAVGVGAYKVTSGYRKAYKEGLDLVKTRLKEEQSAIKALDAKGVSGITRIKPSNTDIRLLAKEYAIEKNLTGFPFYNSQASARIADIKTPRVILNGETVPLVTYDAKRASMFGEGSMSMTSRPSPFRVATTPRQVTTETAGKIPKLLFGTQQVNMASPESWQGALQAGAGQSGSVGRTEGLPRYVPTSGVKPSIPKRIAQLSTGGKFGKTSVGLEALGVVNDIFDSEGNIQRSIREGNRYGVGSTLGLLATLSRAGRGASNALTLGAPEYLGIYDTIDIAQAGSEGERRYLANRKSLGQPPVVNSDNPYLQMFQAQAMAEKEIQKSPVISDFYKGPEYDYKVIDGKLEAILNPLYGAVYDAQSLADLDRYSQSRSMFNVDPRFGEMGYRPRTPSAFNFGDYTEYMQDR